MPDSDRLEQLLRRIDGRSYPAYRDLRGGWRLGRVTLTVDHVQGDPFASPSRVRVALATGLEAVHDLTDADTRLTDIDDKESTTP